jgi:NADH:ubiquinone oxidoreductase subunit 6 (subunit J)
VGGLWTVLSRNIFRAAFALAFTLVITALFYFLLGYPLLGGVQILLYTGGVLTLVVFALALSGEVRLNPSFRKPIPAAVTSLLVFFLLSSYASRLPERVGALFGPKTLAVELFRTYLVAFELLSVLLLAAVIGALMIARKEVQS